jgi:hypothetical protein
LRCCSACGQWDLSVYHCHREERGRHWFLEAIVSGITPLPSNGRGNGQAEREAPSPDRNERELRVARELLGKGELSAKERVAFFIEETGKSREAFFRRQRELRETEEMDGLFAEGGSHGARGQRVSGQRPTCILRRFALEDAILRSPSREFRRASLAIATAVSASCASARAQFLRREHGHVTVAHEVAHVECQNRFEASLLHRGDKPCVVRRLATHLVLGDEPLPSSEEVRWIEFELERALEL